MNKIFVLVIWYFRVPTVIEKFMVMESHGKSKKFKKSWKSENFPLIFIQNVVMDAVVSKIIKLWTFHEKLARISAAKMVMKIRYCYPNLTSKYNHGYGFQKLSSNEFPWQNARILILYHGNGQGKSLIWSWKSHGILFPSLGISFPR